MYCSNRCWFEDAPQRASFFLTFSVLAAIGLADSPSAQGGGVLPFADRVIASDSRGGAGGGIFDPARALGAPGGPTDVHSLGIGGSLTLGFPVVIVDGPGADLLVTENPFRSASQPDQTFAEVFFVEVSSDGVVFARVPTRYRGPQVDPGPFSFVSAGWYEGFGGVLPTNATSGGSIDPLDPVRAGGDAIDLATLLTDPLVLSGAVDLQNITAVRLVDVRTGVDTDSVGVLVRDPGSGSADIDAVGVLQHRGNQPAPSTAPNVQVRVPADGRFEVTIGDPNGLADLDPAQVAVGIWGIEVGLDALLAIAPISNVTPQEVTLTFTSTLPASLRLQMSATARDLAGTRVSAVTVRR